MFNINLRSNMTTLIILFVTYLLALFIIKQKKLFKSDKNQSHLICPQCKNKLKRIERTNQDKIWTLLTFYMFKWKRYNCFSCKWEGIRW